ncbi:MAG: four helix bundle protein [Alphaproteobacteria bacterium]|nr:four helix bundle protein [Alphaproteobacteria bacterium]
MQDFRKIRVWQKAHQLTLDIYDATSDFPQSERYGLTSQMRRSAVSVPANIVEGRARGGDAEFRRFLQIAFGSAAELEYLLLLARDLSLLNADRHRHTTQLVEEVKRMLATFIKKLKAES